MIFPLIQPEVELVWIVGSFLLGAIVGSFLNVVIIRLPKKQSIIYPRSKCPQCDHDIRFYDNIPIISYFLLMGRCRDCGAKISVRYPLVEFVTGCLCLALYWKYGFAWAFPTFFVFCAAMIAVFWIDFDHLIIPDAISVTGTIIGLIAVIAGLVPEMDWKNSLFGIILGGAILYVPAIIYEKVRGIEGLGLGDVKLLAMIGAFTGAYGVVFVLFCSSLAGSLVALSGMLVGNLRTTSPIPFGPFLASAAIFYVFAGQEIIDLFFSLGSRL